MLMEEERRKIAVHVLRSALCGQRQVLAGVPTKDRKHREAWKHIAKVVYDDAVAHAMRSAGLDIPCHAKSRSFDLGC